VVRYHVCNRNKRVGVVTYFMLLLTVLHVYYYKDLSAPYLLGGARHDAHVDDVDPVISHDQ